MTSGISGNGAEDASLWCGPARRVLVLDDDRLIVRVLGRALTRAGLDVEGTTDTEEALAIARRQPPHVVVSDLHMPGACGARFLAGVAESAPTSMRVLMSADEHFSAPSGTILAARVHALASKSRIEALRGLIVAQLRGRFDVASSDARREALARTVARAVSWAEYEDDAHRDRLMRWTSCVAVAMGLPPQEVAGARLGAILHDVGLVAVRSLPLWRRGPLGDADREELAGHADAGARIVSEMPALLDALPVITAHHERQDGAGYPGQLGAAEIPPAVRAFQVVDAYDAMTQGRPHAARRTPREALDELTKHTGKQHAREAVEALRAVGEDGLAAALAP